MARDKKDDEIILAKETLGRERRKHQRFECEGDADVVEVESGRHYSGEMKDLSLTGCYIKSVANLDLKRQADVELHLCVDGDPLTAPARVIVVRPDSGAAFEFLPVDPRMRDMLIHLIQKLDDDPPQQETGEPCPVG
jgi:hypothetical protein